MSEGRGAELQGWVDAGIMTEDEARDVEETIALLLDFVRLGAISNDIAGEIILQLAEEKAAAWQERSSERPRIRSARATSPGAISEPKKAFG